MAAAAIRVVEAHARVYRRTWRGSVISTFLSPVLYLLGMGVGLGTLVNRGAGSASIGIPYLAYLAPGLLAAAAMQTGAGDGSWPVMAGIKWTKTYFATLATPIGIPDLVIGHLGWVGIRMIFVSTVFALVMAAFGAVAIGAGLLAVFPAVLTGLAFAAPVSGYAAWLKRDIGLSNLFRFGIVPMFLFSGTFFPITQLPGWMQPLAYVVPLWHGVELTRATALGVVTTFSPLVHVAYLSAWIVGGTLVAVHTFTKKLGQ
ncbi:ABC-2 type transporter [bacterium BMS3Abin02]|nr:ABC-2 type transporter [bacterium BMS3Abin02]GBE23128.1 ABC-2 type transporter [bacterium BMS3Bbin01]HDH25381.1 ABC transporter [Actinomycetota bacterium]